MVSGILQISVYLTKSENKIILFHFVADAIEIGHGYIDSSGMNPPSVWMKGKPIREDPMQSNDN